MMTAHACLSRAADRQRVMEFLYSALSVYEANAITTIGQNNVYPGRMGTCNNNVTSDIVSGVTVACSSIPLAHPTAAD